MADTTTTTTTTNSPTTPASVHSAATDLAGFFHAQHTALIVHAPHLTHLTLHLPANTTASAIARIQHVASAFFKAAEHRKRHRACCRRRRLPTSSLIGKTARGKLAAASSG